MVKDIPTSVRLSKVDAEDVEKLVDAGVYNNFSDAVRSMVREGVKSAKKERGLA